MHTEDWPTFQPIHSSRTPSVARPKSKSIPYFVLESSEIRDRMKNSQVATAAAAVRWHRAAVAPQRRAFLQNFFVHFKL
jgi:hypothetical protein